MERELRTPRSNWREDCEAAGFLFQSIDGTYGDESRAYRFTWQEVDQLEAAAAELHARCLHAVDHIVRNGRYDQLAIPAAWHRRIADSWAKREPSLYGRFDFAFDGSGPPKLLEYNADTPTALLEASVVQWRWLEQAIRPGNADADQFNSLHEKLIANWRALAVTWSASTPVHFTCADSEEDRGNLDYLRDVALQAGVDARYIVIDDIGYDSANDRFVDADNVEISVLFKLYPWEWMVREEFGAHLLTARIRVIEPAWKMLLSNKGILPILWELNPDHRNLLPAYFEPGRIAGDYVVKPLLSREGENVELHRGSETLAAPGAYGGEGRIWQAYTDIPRFGDDYATLGAWIIGDAPAGVGVREDASPITRNTSRFVPHYFV